MGLSASTYRAAGAVAVGVAFLAWRRVYVVVVQFEVVPIPAALVVPVKVRSQGAEDAYQHAYQAAQDQQRRDDSLDKAELHYPPEGLEKQLGQGKGSQIRVDYLWHRTREARLGSTCQDHEERAVYCASRGHVALGAFVVVISVEVEWNLCERSIVDLKMSGAILSRADALAGESACISLTDGWLTT